MLDVSYEIGDDEFISLHINAYIYSSLHKVWTTFYSICILKG